jgi:glycosyltransferase involved in cell wall biosynthesis
MGRVVPQRQPGAVAAILADVADLAPVVWLGGVKKAPGSLEELARARVPVTGWLPREEALDRLGEASVYLHWTAWDGMPLSILEAMARDVVVIASDIAPNRSILGPRQVFASQAEAISAIRRVLVDEPYRESLLREQRVRRGQYGSTAMMLGWEELYAALTGEVNSPGPDNNPPGRQPCAIADEFAVARVSRRARLTTGGLHRV